MNEWNNQWKTIIHQFEEIKLKSILDFFYKKKNEKKILVKIAFLLTRPLTSHPFSLSCFLTLSFLLKCRFTWKVRGKGIIWSICQYESMKNGHLDSNSTTPLMHVFCHQPRFHFFYSFFLVFSSFHWLLRKTKSTQTIRIVCFTFTYSPHNTLGFLVYSTV